ncbi:MAG: HD domain-containing protein, partial [Anaerolineales bacterium]|nr:HD domain-containing protein [Anaerolineales bacterium]
NNNVDYLFGLRVAKESGKFNEEALINNPEPFNPEPLPDKSKLQSIKPRETSNHKRKLQPWWMVYGYVGIMAMVAVVFVSFIFKPVFPGDWVGLVLFVMIVIFTEILSVEVYLKDASISTSAAPILAGVLLFGPIGAVVLSIVVAVTALIKKGGYLHRFIFDLSSQLIACFLCAGIILLINTPITTLPQPVQIALGVIAGMIVFFSNTWLQSGIISLSVGSPLRQVWKEQFSWLWPYYLAFGVVAYALILGYSFGGVIGVLAIMVPLLTLRLGQIQYVNRTRDVVNKLRANNEKLESQGDEISILNEELLLSLAKSIDLRDPYTMGHSQQVTNYAVMIAKELNLPQEQIEKVRRGSLLHDIGKLGVPDSILLKPGRLTAEEYEVIKKHPLLGAQILESSRNLRNLIPLVRNHHERFDGKGYPDGLVGHAIPIEARILAMADSVEAMASDRPYRRGLTLDEILEEVKQSSGKQFDPRMVKIFLKLAKTKGDRFLVNTAQKVDQGELQQYKASLGMEYAWRAGD